MEQPENAAVEIRPSVGTMSEAAAQTLEACRLAQAAISHAADMLTSGRHESLAEIKRCEERLDHLDREVDEAVTIGVTTVDPAAARQLLSFLKITLDVERIGDLVLSFAERAAIVQSRVEMDDISDLAHMASVLEAMAVKVYEGLDATNIDTALQVLKLDGEIDRLRNLLMIRHTDRPEGTWAVESMHVLFMAQALERAGDHYKNVAEEICRMVTGQNVRHLLRSRDKSHEQMFLEQLIAQYELRKAAS